MMTLTWISDAESRKRTLSCSTTATAHSSASSYTSYNMDADDADHMIYLESRCVIKLDFVWQMKYTYIPEEFVMIHSHKSLRFLSGLRESWHACSTQSVHICYLQIPLILFF